MSFLNLPPHRSEEVADILREYKLAEAAYFLRTYRHKAYYSLDRNDGIEHEALFVAFSPYELYERKVTIQELYTAISRLPDKQAKRIYAHFILGLTKQDIARAEVYRFRLKNEMAYERQSKPRATLARSGTRLTQIEN